MDHQATLVDRPRRDASAQALTRSLANVAQNMVVIAELQARLLAVDLRALRQGVVRGLAMWAIACGLLIAVLATALIGTGLWLTESAHLSTAAGLLWVACGGGLLAIGLFAAGRWQMRKQRVGLNRSGKELRASLAAMQQVLSGYAGRGPED